MKKAVRRNRIRRQLKEIYRLNNTPLKMALGNQTTGLALFLIYTGEEKVEFALLETKLKLLLLELTTHIEVNGIKTIE